MILLQLSSAQGPEECCLAVKKALAWGPTLLSAFDRLETVEQTAKVYYYVSRLGGGVEITQEQADTLRSMVGYYQKLAGKRA